MVSANPTHIEVLEAIETLKNAGAEVERPFDLGGNRYKLVINLFINASGLSNLKSPRE